MAASAVHFGEKLFYGNVKSVKIVLSIIFLWVPFFFFFVYFSCEVGLFLMHVQAM